MTELKTKTLEIFPDDKTRGRIIETLAGCVYVLSDELRKHVDPKDLPEIVGYHVGLGMGILGAVLGRIKVQNAVPYDISYSDADYDQKLDILVETLIQLRETCRERRKGELPYEDK